MSEPMQISSPPKVIQKNNVEQKACKRLLKSIYIISSQSFPQTNINYNTNVETMQICKYIFAYKTFKKKRIEERCYLRIEERRCYLREDVFLAICNSHVLHVGSVLPCLKALGGIKCCVRFFVPRNPVKTLSPV